MWGFGFTLNTTALPALPAVWVSGPHHYMHTCSLLADSWFQEAAISATMALFFPLNNLANKKKTSSSPLRGHGCSSCRSRKKKKKMGSDESVLWHHKSETLFFFWVMLSSNVREKCTIMPLWEESRHTSSVVREVPEWGLFLAWQMRQGEQSGPRQSVLAC